MAEWCLNSLRRVGWITTFSKETTPSCSAVGVAAWLAAGRCVAAFALTVRWSCGMVSPNPTDRIATIPNLVLSSSTERSTSTLFVPGRRKFLARSDRLFGARDTQRRVVNGNTRKVLWIKMRSGLPASHWPRSPRHPNTAFRRQISPRPSPPYKNPTNPTNRA